MRFTKGRVALLTGTTVAIFAVALSTRGSKVVPYASAQSRAPGSYIKHIIVIMQENRSFDSYFGTFPGANGIPMKNGEPTVCNPDPLRNICAPPYHDDKDENGGGPHFAGDEIAEIDGGKMDGFVARAEKYNPPCKDPNNPACGDAPDVMGYHDGGDIPNYWAYARSFVLQDHMFEPNASWSLPAHLFMLSEWSAKCTQHNQPQAARTP